MGREQGGRYGSHPVPPHREIPEIDGHVRIPEQMYPFPPYAPYPERHIHYT